MAAEIVKKHREFDFTKSDKNEFMIVASSKKEMYDKLDEVAKEYKDDNRIYYYPINVRPSKGGIVCPLRPEYAMEVYIAPKDHKGMAFLYREYGKYW